MANGSELCYFIALIVSIGFLIYGFMELLKQQRTGESQTAVISRQIRGFAFIMLAPIIMGLSAGICYALTGQMPPTGNNKGGILGY